ncbi:MAG TPA: NUDIX hydrolase [Frankiaceae bacterium]|jgi:8-oxo-dGTP pyrophosphatase MutT (NUDIX family)|nr:NUDIX hydrolase [Frankiaceae bacterium]
MSGDTLRRLPPELHERARAVASGGVEVAEARHAATVVLLRDGDAGIEAYLLRRLGSMAFAGGMYVFPGGSVDPRDGDADIAWQGPPPSEWAAPLSADDRLARGLVAAAVRETFEEAGVLLASPVHDDRELWQREQAALLDRSASMAEVLARNGLVLRADLLRPWAHWVTPEIEPKRFDTRFFVAALPEGQEPVHYRGESDRSEWVRPADAVERHASGELGMLPPTVFTLAELAAYDTVDAVIEAGRRRDVKRVLPRIVVDGDDVLLLLPGDPGYPE